jgi:hypothetical protein
MDKLTEKVFQSLGQVSMCWSETPKGVFESTEAKKIGDELMESITSEIREEKIKMLEGLLVGPPASTYRINKLISELKEEAKEKGKV